MSANVARLAGEGATFEFEALRYAREADVPDWLVVRVTVVKEGRVIIDQVGELTTTEEVRLWAEGVHRFSGGHEARAMFEFWEHGHDMTLVRRGSELNVRVTIDAVTGEGSVRLSPADRPRVIEFTASMAAVREFAVMLSRIASTFPSRGT